MPTNDERREVAARLRKYIDLDFEDSNPYWYVMKAIYGDVAIHGDNELFARLADLIEPEPERTCHIVAWFEARTRSEIGRELVELSCGHLVERHSKFCKKCGAKVVDDAN